VTNGPGPVLSGVELQTVVQRLADEISRDHPQGVVVVGVLKGSFCFVADLIRKLVVDCEIDFLALSPFREGEARVRIVKDIDLDVAGRDVVLVEDIIDTGLSSRYVMQLLLSRGARRVSLCALLDRPTRRILPLEVAYTGQDVADSFLVGYGLDWIEHYRNLPGLYPVDPSELETAHAAFEAAAYANDDA
jgi:hypoxanthine phosphoribosyltransferase